MLALVVCSCHSGGLLVPVDAATRPLLVRRPYCYSSVACPAAVLLLVHYSPGGRAATRPLLVRRPCCYSSVARLAGVLLLARAATGVQPLVSKRNKNGELNQVNPIPA